MKKRTKELISTIIVILIALIFGTATQDETSANKQQTTLFESSDNLNVYFIDVGQADSILITNQEESMLIDAGNVVDAIANKNLEITTPDIGDKFELGESDFEIKSTIIDKSNLNLSSLVIRLEFGNTSFLFMGDAETENEKSCIWEQATVLKVGHHGSSTSSSANFLKQVKPEISVIMVGKDNDYGHPKQEILNRLENINTRIYRTDRDGTILITSDGNKCEVQI